MTLLSSSQPKILSMFQESVKLVEHPRASSHPLLVSIQAQPLSQDKTESYAQFFTPADVALYTAVELFGDQQCVPLMDPCMGLGSLLIAGGFVLAEQFGLRNAQLLSYLYGNEIDEDTRNKGIENIIQALNTYLDELSFSQAKHILEQQIFLGDANLLKKTDIESKKVIMNPPYKEGSQGNAWIPIVELILDFHPQSIGFILPVSVSCSVRTSSIRKKIQSLFPVITAFHHEIRPRPLFKGVEQRISILTAHQNNQTHEHTYGFYNKGLYLTTGFLTHKSGERAHIWNEHYSCFSYDEIDGLFLKVYPQEYNYVTHELKSEARHTLETYKNRYVQEPVQKIWIRTTGRYHLCAQMDTPKDISSKWKSLEIPESVVNSFLEVFKNGDLLKWWKIFGDGRDISIRALQKEYVFRLSSPNN